MKQSHDSPLCFCAGRYEQLLQYLTPTYFQKTLKHSHSLVPVRQQVEFGFQASFALNRDSEMVRFSIHNSALIQLESTDVLKTEVEARIALDDFDTAIALANVAALKENGLQLFSVIAERKSET